MKHHNNNTYIIILGAGVVVNHASFGRGTGPIWLDNVACGGTESKLISCPAINAYYENHDCDHQEDAGVRCLTGNYYYEVSPN